MITRIGVQHIVKEIGKVQVLRNRDAQRPVTRVAERPGVNRLIGYQKRTHDRRDQRRPDHVAHPSHQAHAHSEKDEGDVARGARGTAKSHEAEGTRHRNTSTHITVDHGNDHAHDGRQHSQGDYEALCVSTSVAVHECKDETERNGAGDAREEGSKLKRGICRTGGK